MNEFPETLAALKEVELEQTGGQCASDVSCSPKRQKELALCRHDKKLGVADHYSEVNYLPTLRQMTPDFLEDAAIWTPKVVCPLS